MTKYQNHHITPRHMLKHKNKDFIDHPYNIVRLNIEEHIKAHKWLFMLLGDEKNQYTYNLMKYGTKSCIYEWTEERKQKLKESIKKSNRVPWNKDKTGIYSEATLVKMSECQLGKKYSDEVNLKKGRPGESHHFYGQTRSESVRDKISSTIRKNKQSKGIIKTFSIEGKEFTDLITRVAANLNMSHQKLNHRIKSVNFPEYFIVSS